MKNSQELVPGQFTIEGLLTAFCKNLKKAHFLNLICGAEAQRNY